MRFIVYVQAHIIVSGMVQGVGFRYFVARRASVLNLSGWVRNLGSGEVEVLAEGWRGEVESLVSDLRAGHPYAAVSAVSVDFKPFTGGFRGFEIAG